MRLALLTLLCGILTAQQTVTPRQSPNPVPSTIGRPEVSTPTAVEQPQTPAPTPQEEVEETGTRFVTGTAEVVTPVLVYDKDGGYVNNIRPDEFRLFDDGVEQNIRVDVSYAPISLVIVVQSNSKVEGLLPHVNKIGSLIGPQVIGEAGEAAVIAYDSRIRTLQDFTSDMNKVTEAVKSIKPGSTSSRMVDAVFAGARMLRTRPPSRRRIMLLIGETRDMGSEARTRETMMYLQLSNVVFYSVNMSRFMTTLTAPPVPSRPDPFLPAMRPLPAGVPATPTSVQQMYGTNARAEFMPLFAEIFHDVKAIFKANPVELFTKATGGSELGFASQRALENAITEIGEQLHSQYMISYIPNNRTKFGLHEIKVQVLSHPEVDKMVSRPGYWLGPAPKEE